MAANVNVGYGHYKNPCTPTESLQFYNLQCLIPAGGFMNIIGALREEELKLKRQLTAVQGAIAALNGGAKTVVSPIRTNGTISKRTMSPEHRARISRATKARWAKFRAEKAKKAK
jgi:hypothetical protein